MTLEEKQLLLKDLCTRLPYNVVIRCTDNDTDYKCFLTTDILNELLHNIEYYDYKPYLRPMSYLAKMWGGLNEEEIKNPFILFHSPLYALDYFLENHIDFRGLIPMGLALEAPKDMYKQ